MLAEQLWEQVIALQSRVGQGTECGGGVGLGSACWSQCVETSVEVLWFHQPRLRSVRPGAPSHILWYVLLPPPSPSSVPRQPRPNSAFPQRDAQKHVVVKVSHMSQAVSHFIWMISNFSLFLPLVALSLSLSPLCSPSSGGQGPLEFCTNAEDREEVTNPDAFVCFASCKTFKGTVSEIPPHSASSCPHC